MKLIKEAQEAVLSCQTRRHFLQQCATGMGAAALGFLSEACQKKESPGSLGQLPRPAFAPKAKAVIFLHMAGSPSQLELFDYKPQLAKLDGQLCPDSFIKGKKFAFIRGNPKLLGPKAAFKQVGQAGHWMSNNIPYLQTMADELCLLKAMYTDQFNHAPAQLLMHTGSARLGRPSMGAWVSYGLGSENQNLPAYMVLASGGAFPDAGKSVWGSGFLPSVYQGVQCRSQGDPILFLNNPEGLSTDLRKQSIEAINQINELQYSSYQDPETLTRISQYEMAYKMQSSVPEAMNIADEPDYIHKMYGTEPGKTSYANNCLLARKLVEKGVRFVQLFDWGWDHHGTSQDSGVDTGLPAKCRKTDQATAALLADLRQRGLLEDTLVIWSGEFGRTPMQENREGKNIPWSGRDHHAEAFTAWMAGGGTKAGAKIGETDEIGYKAIADATSVYDLQATILQLLGFDHESFTYQYQGRPFRLTDVFGKVINSAIA